VHDLVIHPREHELIIATHGRSMFLMDIRPLQALNDQTRAAELHVFDVRSVKLKWAAPREVPPFPPRGRARIHYWLKQPGNVTLTVRNAEGETIRTLQSKGVAGVNDAVWDIRNESGRDLSSGVYQATVTAGSREISTSVTVKP
jgi:hypothetical protein